MIEIPPLRHYKKGDRLYVQAQQIWLILAAFVSGPTRKANDDKTMRYGQLAERMGYADRRAGHMLSRQLGIIGEFCRLNDLPALNSVVVNQATGLPGEDVVVREGRTVKQEQRDVMRQDWLQLGVPTTGTFRKVWESLNE
jgi:hypothetical protein